MGRKSAKNGGGEGEVDPLLQPIQQAFAEDGEVRVGRALSTNGLMVKGKLFAAISKGRLLIKLPKDEIAKLIAEKRGAPFSIGSRIMKEWATIGVKDQHTWFDIARQAREFVGEQSVQSNARSRRR